MRGRLLQRLAGHNYSAARAALVASLPGTHRGGSGTDLSHLLPQAACSPSLLSSCLPAWRGLRALTTLQNPARVPSPPCKTLPLCLAGDDLHKYGQLRVRALLAAERFPAAFAGPLLTLTSSLNLMPSGFLVDMR